MKLLSTMAVKGVLDDIVPDFERAHGIKLETSFGPTAVLLPRIEAGEAADIAILTRDGIDKLTANGVLIPGSVTDLARAAVGLAVKAGAPKPDISTVDAVKATLLKANSVVYSRAGASGIYFVKLIEQLGIADAINARAVITPAGFTGETVAEGKGEIAVQQVSELLHIPGIDVVGPLPDEIQENLMFTGAVFRTSRHVETATALLRRLSSPDLAALYRAKGLLP